MATLPPWLQISPSDFTAAAIAGGQQGYQAAAQAGELAQRGLLQAAELASQAANRAAEIAVRREAINASLAENAARVAAAQSEAAAQNSIRQQQIELARAAEQNNVAQEQARLAAAQELKAMDIQGEKDVAGIRANAPNTFAPSEAMRMISEADALEAAGKSEQAKAIRDVLNKRGTVPTPATRLTPDQSAQLKALGERLAEIDLKLSAPGKTFFSREEKPPDPDLVNERSRLQKRLDEILGKTAAETNAPAGTNLPVGGPLRYQLINGQYQLTQ